MTDSRVGNTEGKNDPKVISDIIAKHATKENSPAGVTERYMNDIKSYLKSKLPCCSGCCVSPDILDEIAVYCANRMTVSMTDALIERDREWKKIIEKNERAATVSYKKGDYYL